MRFEAVLIIGGATLAAVSAGTLAQSTKPSETGEKPAAAQGGQDRGDQRREPDKVGTEGQAQSQESIGPLETQSGGASAASPQGGTPPGMQVIPQGSPEQRVPSGQGAH
jgi:hypothetical protein